jgi:hypothetical protein
VAVGEFEWVAGAVRSKRCVDVHVKETERGCVGRGKMVQYSMMLVGLSLVRHGIHASQA